MRMGSMARTLHVLHHIAPAFGGHGLELRAPREIRAGAQEGAPGIEILLAPRILQREKRRPDPRLRKRPIENPGPRRSSAATPSSNAGRGDRQGRVGRVADEAARAARPATTQSTVPLVTLARQCAQVPSRFKRSSAPHAGQRAAITPPLTGVRAAGRAHEVQRSAMPLIAAFIGDHLIGIVKRLGAIHQIEVNLDALTRCVALRILDCQAAHIQALQQRMPMLRLGLRDAAATRR